MDIAFIYFDIDNTLLDHSAAERAALADLHAHFSTAFNGVPVATLQTEYHRQSVPLWKQYAAGDIDKSTVKRERFARTFQTLGIDLDPVASGTFYMRRYAAHWQWVEGARSAFLSAAGHYPVGIITNGFAKTQSDKLSRFPELQRRSEAVIISEEVGALKPQPRLFSHAATKAGLPPGKILYVGDSYSSDVLGATRAGWQMAWYLYNGESEKAPVALRFTRWDAFTQWLP